VFDMKKTDGIKVLATALALLFAGAAQVAKADDTEIYRVDEEQIGLESVRPKVLIVFDDSGSMRTTVTAQPPEYTPTGDYDAGIPAGRIYWSTNGQPPSAGSSQWFVADKNRCGESFAPLASEGVYQGTLARWQERNSNRRNRWNSLSTGARNPEHVECRNDTRAENPDNGSGTGPGYAQTGVATALAVAGSTPDDSNAVWRRARNYTLFTSHRMNYEYDPDLQEDRPRIDIAADAVIELIQSNPSVDFGLLEFNYNTGNAHGGRIVRRIIENSSAADRTNLVNLVDSLQAAGATPLCESAYEAYRYLTGGDLLWGDNQDIFAEGGRGDPLPRDLDAEDPRGSRNYDSPLRVCSSVYVILMTDGNPSSDDQANDRIQSMIASIPADAPQLTEPTCQQYQNDSPTTGMRTNCLPQLAEYMATQDLSPTLDGDQHAFMYTIGFQSEQQLLEDTARLGGGLYFTANTSSELAAAFRGAILDILSQNTTFTSPAVAVDTFTRTESLNKVFFSMFRPTEGIDWPGNVKMLEVSTVNGERILVDKNGASAIDPTTGFIRDNASTFWSSTDGPEVTEGGVGGLLAAGDPAARTLYTDTGANGALVALSAANVEPEFFGVATDEERDLELAYARGFEIENGASTGDPRSWIMGDVLHSQPLVVNYGARTGAFSVDNPDLRILVGTNSGFIHMFGAADGQEDWAILPELFGANTSPRRIDEASNEHLYGVDLSPVVYIKDANNDGSVIPANDDLAYAFFGLRRGGSGYLAYDITSPDSPATLWRISEATPGFEELGQSWSQPVIAFVPGHVDANGAPKPALIFGAGYDTALDDQDGPFSATDPASYTACDPVCGRGVFVVDAATGALLWSVTPGDTTTTNLKADGLRFPVAADVTPIDSNGDGISDRIYFSDVGGNVWRVDMAGNQLPADMTAATRNCSDADTLCGWQVNKIADLNDGTVAGDRRFFNAPDIVRTRFNGAAVDAVLIASGDRTNPNGRDVRNRFYVIRDKASTTYTTPPPGTCDPDTVDFRCSLPITEAGLRNISANPIDSDATDDEVVTAFSSTAGWYIEFLKDSTPLEGKYGEKGLARSLTIGGTVFVTTFVPRPEEGGVSVDEDVCTPESGAGYLYLIDLFSGRFVSIAIAPVIPDSPSVFYGEDGSISLLLPPGTPSGLVNDSDVGTLDCNGGVCRTDQVLPRSYGNYWLEEDY
jgi:type IV pilus assembly protein PilY1